mmetsp:Transcript_4730/g.10264  ORF Transcript_4730/g.10264 Transcript_4730/m.10264 type:complete len:86 (+) Transcript_4730:868-1125(+)
MLRFAYGRITNEEIPELLDQMNSPILRVCLEQGRDEISCVGRHWEVTGKFILVVKDTLKYFVDVVPAVGLEGRLPDEKRETNCTN